MSDQAAFTRNAALSAATLVTSMGTLLCCVLPAVFVALGAGAALAVLVTAVPQLIWLSEHKALVFGIAGALLIVSGLALRYGRFLPCPADPAAARVCRRLRRASAVLYASALAAFLLGVAFAFILPRLNL